MALTTLTTVSGMLVITQTEGLQRNYGSDLIKQAKFAPSSDGLYVNLTIGGDVIQIPFADVKVNSTRATTLSSALTLLNSILGS